jgi:putative endonuclease
MFWRGRRKKTRQELARTGEDHAARYLRSKGYRVRERNFRTRTGEVDIIADHGEVLVFVEVKSRTSAEFGEPRESVTPRKQQRILRAARGYLASREPRERMTRFDVVEVFITAQGRVEKVELIEGAFGA